MSFDAIRTPLAEAALLEVRRTFPAAVAEPMWTETSGDRALVVVELTSDAGRYLHQVVCYQDKDGWFGWTSGPAPGLLDLDETFSVLTRFLPLRPGASVVRVRHFVDEQDVPVVGPIFVQVLWDVTPDGSEIRWPEPVGVQVDGSWHGVAIPGIPVDEAFLVASYVEYEDTRLPALEWAWEVVDEGVREHPDASWPIILRAIEHAPSDEVLFAIAAGPLENLLRYHGAAIIERVERATLTSSALKRALCGVWIEGTNETLARRVERIRAR